MADMQGLQPIAGCDNAARLADVIFVHGLDGDARSTWHPKGHPDAFWPAWLGEDVSGLGIWSLGYAVSASAWKGHSMPLYDRAENILDVLELDGIGQRPVAFICHSLGGLLIKQLLRTAHDAPNPAWQAIVRHTRLMVFLSTPHSGASLASWITYVRTLLRTTVSVEELEAHHPRLRELNDWYRDRHQALRLTTFVYYETRPVANILVVDASTANPGIPGVRPIALDEDHVSICKPASRNGQVYRRVKRLLADLLRELGGTAPEGPGTRAYRHYYEECEGRWSEARHALDKRFVQLTLLVDQGEDAPGPRWHSSSTTFGDLSEVLAHVPEPAVVVLGPPGSGKSTLLRHYELECAQTALALPAGSDLSQAPLTLFVPLNDYPPAQSPLPWLAARWSARYPDLPALEAVLRQRRMTLLLDALNEMPGAAAESVRQWKAFVRELAQEYPGNRVVFSCRSLEYSATLSSKEWPVPQVRLEALSDAQVQEFVMRYCPQHGATLWDNLQGTPQLEILRSPYYLTLLIAQTTAGEIPRGRAALFTGFVRSALKREVEGDNALLQSETLLPARDRQRLIQTQGWRTPVELPERGILFPRLSALAFQMQTQRQGQEAAQVRIVYDEAMQLLEHGEADTILKIGSSLGVLAEQDLVRDEVLFVHQLLQEYFAARHLAPNPQAALAQQEWRADRVLPSLPDTLRDLGDADPLPPLPSTGWEETMLLAVAMTPDRAAFLTALMGHNLALAGRCAALPEVDIPATVQDRIRQALVQRTQDPAADLRARIAAGLALGEVGDPRFIRQQGAWGEYLLPPLMEIPGGTYAIGSDEGVYENEAPSHAVELQPFAIGQFPVTNTEWRLFMQAGGYEEERWWDTDEAQAWRCGEGTAAGAKQQRQEERQYLQDNFDQIRQLHQQGRITSKQADDWEAMVRMSDDEFATVLDGWYPAGRQTQPASWNDDAFNNPAQPVVGICWYEARAYCAWLSAQTRQTLRLPTEVEWEAAARGRQSRRFAFGNDFDATHGNTFETHLRRTTPIGVFPGGETPEGVVDMTGNVWEWTSSQYKPYPYDAADGREAFVIPAARRAARGGSWNYDHVYARASCRFNFAPDRRNIILGVRVVRASPSRS